MDGDDLGKSFGLVVRRHRLNSGLTQEGLAELASHASTDASGLRKVGVGSKGRALDVSSGSYRSRSRGHPEAMSPDPRKRRESAPSPDKDRPFGSSESGDHELEKVASELSRLEEAALAIVFRKTFDQIYDGQRTGRYSFDQLYKTEKTHFGTLIEINLQHQFAFSDGKVLDFEIGGVEVDCKYSKDIGGWMIPEEARGRLCLLVWASDQEALWSLGIVRAAEEALNLGVKVG
jgi:Restriction endonuclease NaeI